MNEALAFVQNWLAPGETITCFVEDVLWNFKPSYPVRPNIESNDMPSNTGIIALTNRRLVLVELNRYNPLPRWYSATSVISLSERPPGYDKDRKKHDWPYQAEVTLSSGVILVLETPKDDVDRRGKALSALLVNALLQLAPGQPSSHLFQAYAHQYEEQRKRDSDYYDTPKKEADK